jgi:hypothetical protein
MPPLKGDPLAGPQTENCSSGKVPHSLQPQWKGQKDLKWNKY